MPYSKNIIFLTILSLFSASAFADIEFYNKSDGSGRLEGRLPDSATTSMNLKKEKKWNNDEIKSVRLKSVTRGTIIQLFDDPDAKKNDDWVEIYVKKSGADIVIGNLERNHEDSYYKQTFHKKNGLNGKVSHIKVDISKQVAADVTLPSKFTSALQGYFTFNKKNGLAHELKSQDSNYRVWKPDFTVTPGGGAYVSLKMDHIRGSAQDDHAQVELTFNSDGRLTKLDFKISLADDQSYVQTITDIAKVSKDIAKTSNNPKAIAGAEVGAALASATANIYGNAVGKWANHGGRANFPSVIKHQANNVAQAAQEALFDQKMK